MLKRRVVWKNMTTDLGKYFQSCEVCARSYRLMLVLGDICRPLKTSLSVERSIRTINLKVSLLINENKTDSLIADKWDELLQEVVYFMNILPHATVGGENDNYAHYLFYGWNPVLLVDLEEEKQQYKPSMAYIVNKEDESKRILAFSVKKENKSRGRPISIINPDYIKKDNGNDSEVIDEI
uniref:Integrase catalytic domain-containing protein n=1 Tax=Strongyloides venezuelensis TaxID=75913 RepID=A0A0K0FRH4_STRVS